MSKKKKAKAAPEQYTEIVDGVENEYRDAEAFLPACKCSKCENNHSFNYLGTTNRTNRMHRVRCGNPACRQIFVVKTNLPMIYDELKQLTIKEKNGE